VKALIKVGYGCNNHCTFCHTLDVRDIDGASAEVEAKIDRAARLGHSMIVLSGGEVTMRPELLKWASRSAALGLDFGLVTNGRALAYPDLVDKLLERRLKYVYMSLHGGDAKIHNLLVRADAFEQTYRAVQNLAGKGLDFTVNAVVTRQNLNHLRPIVDAVLPFPDVVLKFSMVQPKGGGDKHFDRLIPKVSQVAEKVRDAIEYGLARGGTRYAHDGIPFCLLPAHEDRYDDLKTHRFATMIEIGEPDFFPVDDRAKVQPRACDDCSIRGACPGLYRGYAEVHGVEELHPVKDRPRSNSFNWVFDKVVGTTEGGCPVLRDGTTPWDRGRHVFVRKGDKVARYATTSRDFTDLEIEATKHELGQIYVDVSNKDAPDDFARDLRKLERSAMCRGCVAESTCAGTFELVRDDVFTRDDARVRELLGELRGDVLDLGCGEAPYADVLAPLIAAGTIRYFGVEPDENRVEALRQSLPGAHLRVGVAEDLDLGDQRFDHVLLLRSWNHLRDPDAVIASIAKHLRPNATVIVVDNVAFGLVRAREQAARAEGGRAEFEHYRNDTATLAHARFEKLGWSALDRAEVSPATSNQWLLRYRAHSAAAEAGGGTGSITA
jgi:MoaA/NifB/PqqE/SkfB family radical SAM enzyme/SAM-dependent methyltransferase